MTSSCATSRPDMQGVYDYRSGLYRSPLLNPNAATRGSGATTSAAGGGGYYHASAVQSTQSPPSGDTPTHRALGLLDERPRSSRRHYHDYTAPNDAAGLLNARRSKDPVPSVRLQKDQPTRVVVVGEPLPAPPPPAPRPGSAKPAEHLFGPVLQRDWRDWRSRRESAVRVFPETHARVGTANPLTMLPLEVPPSRPMRAPGTLKHMDAVMSTLSADSLAHDVAKDLAGMWPRTRPEVTEPQRRIRATPVDGVASRDGSRMKTLLTSVEVLPLPPQAPPVLTFARANDFAANKVQCGSVHGDLVAPPLYEVRPGAEPGAHRSR